jgi:hypothetical protein
MKNTTQRTSHHDSRPLGMSTSTHPFQLTELKLNKREQLQPQTKVQKEMGRRRGKHNFMLAVRSLGKNETKTQQNTSFMFAGLTLGI